ncbi:MAG: OmpH family outer membrane protein [Candidatus Hydrogenedentota bacterium]|mgnify:FL=1
MKKSVLVLAAVACLGLFSQGADALTVGVIDMLKVSEGYNRYLESRKILEARKTELQDVVDDEEKSVLALIDQLEAIRATASQDEIMKRRQEVEQRDKELREFVMSTNTQFRDDLDSLQYRTRNEIETAVHAVARAKGLDIVIERNMTLFSTDALDVTAELIVELNNRYKPLPAPAARPAASSSSRTRTPSSPTAIPNAAPAPTTPGRGWPFRDER